jgi:hypothetical protein
MRPDADVAQLAEQLICNQQVVGSNPTVSSKFLTACINSGASRFLLHGRKKH